VGGERSIAEKIGCTAETLRKWVRQAERDAGTRPWSAPHFDCSPWGRKNLVSKGLAADRITTVSRGGGRPICEEGTPTCRAINRRASFSPGVP